MPDLFGKKQLGRATTGGRFYATPTERVEAGAIYFPDESSLLFGVAEYTVEAGNLGAFATEGTFVFEKPNDWLDSLGRKVFFRPSTSEIVNQDRKGDVLIGFQIFANVPDDKLGVVLTQGENSVVIIVTSTADSGAGSLRQAIADANDGDVILFDADVFPAGQTTSILLSSYLSVNKSVSIYGGFNDGNGGYTSGAEKRFYVYRDVEGVKTKVYITDETPAQEGETVLFENVCRVALDGQATQDPEAADEWTGWTGSRCAIIIHSANKINIYGLAFANGLSSTSEIPPLVAIDGQTTPTNDLIFKDCAFVNGINTAGYCGGIRARYAVAPTFNDCEFNNNKSKQYGGGSFYSTGNATSILNRCVIANSKSDNGGGLYSASKSQNTLNDCTISGCSATTYGGGVYAGSSSICTFTGCTITGNTAISSSGGIYGYTTGALNLNDCAIKDNITSGTSKDINVYTDTTATINNSIIGYLRVSNSSNLTINGITLIDNLTLSSNATITINDGAALTITTAATIGAATFTSEGRGYLATASGIDTSSATLTNVVLCAYGAGLETFTINEDGASWTADDLTTPILIEQKGDGATWTTLSDDATGGSYSDSFEIGTTLRAFDGVRFFVASLDAYWQVEPFVVASNGGGGAGDDSPSWTISDATITPNAEEV